MGEIKEDLPESGEDFLQTITVDRNELTALILMALDNIKADRRFYDIIINQVTNPAAIAKLGMIEGGRQLQKKLNILIVLNRLVFLIMFLLVVLALLKIFPYYSLIAIPVIFIVHQLTLNPKQTSTNIELGARLALYDSVTKNEGKIVKIKFK